MNNISGACPEIFFVRNGDAHTVGRGLYFLERCNLELGFISESKIREALNGEFEMVHPGFVVFNDDVAFMDNDGDPENRGYSVFDKDKIDRCYAFYERVKRACD